MGKRLEIDASKLLRTPYDELTRTFPGTPRRQLLELKRQLAKQQPEAKLSGVEKVRQDDLVSSLTAEKKDLLRQVLRLEDQLSLSQSIPTAKVRKFRVKPGKTEKREATAVVVGSDWHAAEHVDPETVNGLNEFTLDIFKERAAWFFTNAAKLVNKEASCVKLNRVVVALIGDLITNTIHDDLLEGNLLGPMDEVILVQDTIVTGINEMLTNLSPTTTITIIFKLGNHSRVTKKQRVATEASNSLEWVIAAHVASFFANEPRVQVIAERGYHTYLQLYDTTLRFHHGHALRYMGGVGGITIPANKMIANWNRARKADLDVFGHFHYLFWGGNFVANGSLIGYGPFSERIAAPFQRPQQAFFLIDSQFGLTMQAPILLERA